MRIRIVAADPDRPGAWFNSHVGEEFSALGIKGGEYVLDLAEAARTGTIPGNPIGGKAYVPVAFAQQVEQAWRDE